MNALERCIPDIEKFKEHWGKSAIISKNSGPYQDLLSINDIEHILNNILLTNTHVRLVSNNKRIKNKKYTRTIKLGTQLIKNIVYSKKIFEHFNSGYTIVINLLHEYWKPITLFCRALEKILGFPIQANAYITPANSVGFRAHYDQHDVFILQLYGKKKWTVYPVLSENPKVAAEINVKHAKISPIVKSEYLNEGDALYIPAGSPHFGSTTDDISIHLSVGINYYVWADFINRLFEFISGSPTFRKRVPISWANNLDKLQLSEQINLFMSTVSQYSEQDMSNALLRDFVLNRRTLNPMGINDSIVINNIKISSSVKLKTDAILIIEQNNLYFTDGELVINDKIKQAIAEIKKTDSIFKISDVALHLTESNRINLIKKLISVGALEIVSV